MERRDFITLLGAAVFASSTMARAQQSMKVYRIGFLGSSVTAQTEAFYEALLGRLRELGYAEGRNLIVERRFTEGRNERYHSLATEFVNLKVNLIVAPGTVAAQAAKEATSIIPIVTVVVGDPVGSRLIASLDRPGGNVTGMSSSSSDLTAKELQLLNEIVPHLSRVAVLFNPTSKLHAVLLKELEVAATILRVRLQSFSVRAPDEIESAFERMAKDSVEALIILDDPLMAVQSRGIVELATLQRLPTISTERSYAEAGSLLSYGASFPDLFRRAATYVDKILRGAKPADLPVEQPTKFEMVINLKTAKTLGLVIPSILLARADEVIE
ncbi:ABC transporter substrate-binding protein [Bradyrhizobium iriomotense]|uniref:ABC transporter substrate-binding protein n=1 Tax=Bradyrhizobium iriomotense TaxID=441950 RepID=UPI001B8A468F|nr:ABC transporter substrate-binding protein [Bradyrhizobium iriomotense]MBR1133111.1 ABC transporter substrate-binding protein [Bradyrhizobium iriomotense]